MRNIEDITKKLEDGVEAVFTSGQYADYLRIMSRFHNYSASNCLLIMMQCPQASLVAGFRAWQDKFKRNVRKGEKAIKILAPCPHKKIVLDKDGEEQEVKWTSFRAVNVFDVSQTDGEELPELCGSLDGSVEDFADLKDKLEGISPVPVSYEKIGGSANGYYSLSGMICIDSELSEQHMVKTLIHEIAHAMLHGKDGEEKGADRDTKEVQAESVAYVVCSALGIDTSDYSFGYVAGWGGDPKVVLGNLEVIRKTANEILDKVA